VFPPLRHVLLLLLATLVLGSLAYAKKDEGPKPTPWSFQPLQRMEPPAVKDKSWPKTRIDFYLLAKMEAAGLQPAPRADDRVLKRRLAYDLTGLPPKDAQITDYRLQVEEYLASPHHGERWARHWLDLARYTDITPDWLDSTKYAYLYRDWVVKAFNEDLPYDQFVTRQLAVDMLPGSSPEDRVALGFLGLSPTYFKELQLPPEIIKTTVADEWEEHVDAVGRTFLGLTLACARCHDHKSDPVTAADYYAIAGVFASVKLAELPTMGEEFWAPVAKARGAVATLEGKLKDLAKRKPKDLAEQKKALEAEIARIKSGTPHYMMPMANGVEDAALFVVNKEKEHGTKLDYKMGMARDLETQLRGNPNDLGEVVQRRFLSAFPAKTGKPRKFATGSGRLELAQAIVEDAAPLTARVIVNRVWKHHFGRGLVDTPSELGNLGEAPTHPELLDDLTGRFMEHGWSLKWLHREILHSAAWQQSSVAEASELSDPDNKLYARMTRRRLDWEAWRDSMLTASGQLDLSMGGPAGKVSDLTNFRRSLYAASDRQDMDPMLRIHDVPDPGAHSPWRTETITPLQGLFALNSPFVHQLSETLGRWAKANTLEQTFTRLYQRSPSPRERAAAEAFVKGREADPAIWTQYAQALLVGNEMQFID